MKLRNMAALVAVLTVFGCNKENKTETPPEPALEDIVLSAEIESVGLTSIDVKVSVPAGATFYAAIYKPVDFFSLTVDSIVEQLKYRVEVGASWAQILRVGSQTVSFTSLNANQDYRIIVFGLRGDGSVSSKEVVLNAMTDKFSATLDLAESTPFGFNVHVTPSRDDVGWFGFTFIDAERASDELLLQYIRYYIADFSQQGYTYDELTVSGEGLFSDFCYPGENITVAIVGLDKSLKVVSDVHRLNFTPSEEGLTYYDEMETKHIRTGVYAYNNEELGTYLEFKGYDEAHPGYPNYVMGFNGETEEYFGIDLFKASKQEVANALAWDMQEYFDKYYNSEEYAQYFDGATAAESIAMLFYDTSVFVEDGVSWDRYSPDSIEEEYGEPVDDVVLAASILDIDDDFKIYPVENAVSRISFKEIGYDFKSFTPASAVSSVMKTVPVQRTSERPSAVRVNAMDGSTVSTKSMIFRRK